MRFWRNIWARVVVLYDWAAGQGAGADHDPLDLSAFPAAIPPAPAEEQTQSARQGDNVLSLERYGAASAVKPRPNDQRSRGAISKVFGASQPVENRSELCGRQRELDRLFDSICDSNMHALIYGPRGSGKTSLARVFGDYADERGFSVIYLSCAGSGTFTEIMAPYLEFIPAACFGMSVAEHAALVRSLSDAMSARSLAGLLVRLRQERVILILDEFDRVEDEAAKNEIATLVKLLSDMRATVRLLMVGIASNVDDLIGAHPSVRRHLAAVAVPPLREEEVDAFIIEASELTGVTFTDDARQQIRWIVHGSPYHMRLFCLQACFEALDADKAVVDLRVATAGVRVAFDGWKVMNERDAALFSRVAKVTGRPLTALETIARAAVTLVDFGPDEIARIFEALPGMWENELWQDTLEQIAPALRQLPGPAQKFTFDDALAPPFLLAACALEQQRRKAIQQPAIGRG